jgi:hypothetical protein
MKMTRETARKIVAAVYWEDTPDWYIESETDRMFEDARHIEVTGEPDYARIRANRDRLWQAACVLHAIEQRRAGGAR